MRHKALSRRVGVKTGHRIAMLRNLTAALVEHGRIRTTTIRAKSLRTFVERLVTRLKEPTVANIRVASSKLGNRKVALKIAHDISPKFKTRPGGYVRILKLAQARAGDAADLSLIEWSEEALVPQYQEKKAAPKASGKKKKAPAKAAKKADDSGEEKASAKKAKK
jgi:large subunit ribosomal protein L17